MRRLMKQTCEEMGCPQYEQGYQIVLNTADPADTNLARYLDEGKAQRFFEKEILMDGAVAYKFPAGQPCLRSPHDVPSWDDPVYIVGERKTTKDEWHTRLSEGAEALVAATTRLKEMED